MAYAYNSDIPNQSKLVQFLYGVKDFHFSFGKRRNNFQLTYFLGVMGSFVGYIIAAANLASVGREIESALTILIL